MQRLEKNTDITKFEMNGLLCTEMTKGLPCAMICEGRKMLGAIERFHVVMANSTGAPIVREGNQLLEVTMLIEIIRRYVRAVPIQK